MAGCNSTVKVSTDLTDDDDEEEDVDDDEDEAYCWFCGNHNLLPRLTNKSDKLCAVCKDIKVYDVLSNGIERRDERDEDSDYIPMGWIDEMSRNTQCPMCRLAVDCVKRHYSSFNFPSTFWGNGIYNGYRRRCLLFAKRWLPKPGLFWELKFGLEPPLYRPGNIPEGFEGEPLDPLPRMVRVLSQGCLSRFSGSLGVPGRKIYETVIPEVVAEWIRLCSQDHPIKGTNLPKGVRMIDLKLGCLVEAPPACRFVALSYVWGGPQAVRLDRRTRKKFQKLGSLTTDTEGLCRTIKDAMLISSQIKERYLWIDALCVLQDDSEDVKYQVSLMGQIYRCAIVTLIATEATNADCPLPGVVKGSRQVAQGLEVVERMALACRLPHSDDIVDKAYWNSRAWTYQEYLLSERLLHFTNAQVWFHCKRGCIGCEDMWEDSQDLIQREPQFPSHHVIRATYVGALLKSQITPRLQSNLSLYCQLVEKYTGRQLTNQEDALNAFSGVLAVLDPMFGRLGFIYGLPVAALDVALLWRPVSDCNRRSVYPKGHNMFPSWSWAGWEGSANYRAFNMCETSVPAITWITLESVGQSVVEKFVANTCSRPSEDWLHENSHLWHRRVNQTGVVYYTDLCGDAELQYAHPITMNASNMPSRAIDLQTGHMHFFAKVASFSVDAQQILWTIKRVPGNYEEGSIRHVVIHDSQGHVAGVVMTDPKLMQNCPGDTYDFIAIVQATPHRFLRANDGTDSQNKRKLELSQAKFGYDPLDKDFTSPLYSSDPPLGSLPFDPAHYDYNKEHPMYEVLLVEMTEHTAQRLGVGYIHVDAFDAVAVEKYIVLT